MALVPELEKIRQEAEAASAQARALCEGLGEGQLAWRPQPGQWSIAENLLHLETTTQVMLPNVDRAIDEARHKGLCSHGLGRMGRFYVWYVEPPPPIRLPAPRMLRPVLEGSSLDALPRFLRSQDLMLDRLERADGVDIAQARFISPMASYIRMSLYALFSVFTAHERRHLWQATNVRQKLMGEVR
jgi:hypothetical protein